MRRLIAGAIAAGALVAPASASAVELRGENSVGLPVVVHLEGSRVTRYQVTVPAFCGRQAKRAPSRKRMTVRFSATANAAVEPDGFFRARSRSGRRKAEIAGWVSEGNQVMGRFKLLPFKSGRWSCISPRVNWGVGPVYAPGASGKTGLSSAGAASWEPGEYRGSTSQGREARMGFTENQVFRHGFEINTTCTKKRRGRKPARRREGGRYTSGSPVPLGPDGRWSVKRKRGRFRTSFSGQVSGDKATGKFQLTFKESGGWTCKSPTISFQVKNIARG